MSKITVVYALIIGFLLDLCFGDPKTLPHPVVAIGWFISFCEKHLRKILPKTKKGELFGGAIMVVVVASVSYLIPSFILYILGTVHPLLALLGEGFMCFQILAAKSLKDESMNVYNKLKEGDLPLARSAVARIVGRDTASLSAVGVTKAAVETVAENTNDGVVAPMLFIALGGARLGFFYKAVNTMDSMTGYKNERYISFGKTAARLDDICNYLPSRLSAVMMIIAAFLLRYNYKNAIKIFIRDRHNHSSPNSAQTESVCAGALDVMLAGDAYYFGRLVQKPTIGDSIKPIDADDIIKANRLLYVTAFLSLLFCIALRLTAIKLFLGAII
mgnify:CR=1 FL=1